MVEEMLLVGIGVLFMAVLLIITLAASGGLAASYGGKARRAARRQEHVMQQEHLARLRHRSLEQWAKEVNVIRAQKGLRGIPMDVLRRVQFNLRYSIDEDRDIRRRSGHHGHAHDPGPGPGPERR